MKKDKITIIGQCYNEEVTIPIYYKAMKKLMKKMNYVDFEIIFVDDNSSDSSLNIIKKISKLDDRIKYISMSRNFGREACAMAGFKMASGDYVTTMDIDLQDPPELLIDMYDAIKKEGYDIGAALALTRKGYSKIHRFCIKIFYALVNKISTVKMINGQREYRLMTRQVVEAILEYNEYNLFNKGLLNDVGFKIKWIEYENKERVAGNTKFPYGRMIKYAIRGIIDYSTVPLTIIITFGIFLFIVTLFLIFLTLLFICLSFNIDYTILVFSIVVLLLFSLQTLMIGILSLYISQIHLEVKRRPLYIIRESNFKKMGVVRDEKK